MKLKYLLAASVAAVMSAPAAVVAADTDMPSHYVYLGGHIGEYYHDVTSRGNDSDNPRVENNTLLGGQIGWRFAERWSIQADIDRHKYSFKHNASKGHMNTYFGQVRYHFSDTSVFGFEPYAGVAAGEIRLTANGSDDHNRESLLGPVVGMQTMLLPYLSLDLGASPLWRMDSDSYDGKIYAGLNFIFGATAKDKADEAVQEPVVVEESPVVGDADGDGVPDSVDQCAGTPAGVAVNAAGCPLDGDVDGVPDYLDKCPRTPEGALVDENGCQKVLTKDLTQTLHVQFEVGKAKVKEESYGDISEIAIFTRQYPDAKVSLEGYTDSTGSEALNKRLSGERAQAVKDVLVDVFHIDGDRISVEGHGPANPIASNDTAEGRAENRRVEVILKAQTEEAQFQN